MLACKVHSVRLENQAHLWSSIPGLSHGMHGNSVLGKSWATRDEQQESTTGKHNRHQPSCHLWQRASCTASIMGAYLAAGWKASWSSEAACPGACSTAACHEPPAHSTCASVCWREDNHSGMHDTDHAVSLCSLECMHVKACASEADASGSEASRVCMSERRCVSGTPQSHVAARRADAVAATS